MTLRPTPPRPAPVGPVSLRIVSGGQTGVDRAALDAALAAGAPCGGFCPRGRAAEDGPIPPRYPLTETAGDDPAERTRANIDQADATLILTPGQAPAALPDGTRLTAAHAEAAGKPLRVVALPGAPADTAAWLRAHAIRSLNVAGPRESTCPGVYAAARAFMDALLAAAGDI